MAFSLSFFTLLEDLNMLFCPAFQHFLLWPEPQLLNTTLNLALWSWKFRWNYSIIDFKAEACESLMASLWLATSSLRGTKGGQKCELIFVVGLTLAEFQLDKYLINLVDLSGRKYGHNITWQLVSWIAENLK